jgi:CBS domain-containing protein
MANAAFFLGLLVGLPEELGDVTKLMPFDLVKSNFFNVARYGICSQITWLDGKSWRAGRLIREQLLPVAYEGLRHAGIDEVDIERLLRIIDERVQAENTGAAWMIQSLAAMDPRAKANVRMRTLTAAMIKNQKQDIPVHEWKLADIPRGSEWIDNYKTVEPFMTTDLFTVHPEDVVDLAASLMHWRHIRHVPVEDDEGRLIGILSHRDLLRLVVRGELNNSKELAIRDVMKTELITISPETPTLEALRLMRENNIGCLPVVRNERLLGLVTAYDFLTVSAKLLEEKLRETIAAEESRKSSPRNLSKVQGGSQK